jgi:hypothetical protein
MELKRFSQILIKNFLNDFVYIILNVEKPRANTHNL